MVKINTALVSVYDKTDIIPLCEFLSKNGVKIISTGGSFKALKQNGIEAVEISDFTGFPEMMGGRLKTLHPKIHGGLLGRKMDLEDMKAHNICEIDLVIVNLYPFEETVLNSSSNEDIIEKIDIGGPSMLRSAAKNHERTVVISSPKDYNKLTEELTANNFCTSFDFRRKMAGKAFSITGFYDSVISGWFEGDALEREVLSIPLRKKQNLRYGENPHQKAGFYEIALSKGGLSSGRQIQGKELSYNNIADADAALEAAFSFTEPAVCIVKHANPCGLATGKNIVEAYELALSCDPKSAFGGIVACNMEVTSELAEKIKSHFYEVIIAKSFTKEAREILSSKPNLRLIEILNSFDESAPLIKSVNGGMLLQERDNIKPEFEVAANEPSHLEMKDLEFSFSAVKFFKSNAIVITKGTKVVSFGCGQTSRVDAMEIATKKMIESGIDPSECILSSDAFFPFTDNLEIAKKAGIKVIIAPSGSIRDEEVKNYAKQNGITLIFAKTRHFRH